MNEFWLNLLEFLGLAWWIEVVTDTPSCTYYFGPFLNIEEAKEAQSGYIEDLQQEGAVGIRVTLKRCKPEKLTVFDEETEMKPWRGIFPVLSGQL